MRACVMLPICAVVCVDGFVSFSVHACFTVVGKARPCAVVLGVSLFAETVMRACYSVKGLLW